MPPRQHGPLTPQFGTYGLQTEKGGCSLSPELVALLGQRQERKTHRNA